MRYNKIVAGKFIERPNRFIAIVDINGNEEIVHVKNTGRCREILKKGCRIILEESENPNRKTKYDLIAAYKDGFGLINIDSQAPNYIVKEWLEKQDYSMIKPEFKYGDSRIDFYMEKGTDKYLMEVKGCTLEKEGIGYFPDAPTTRGIKHLNELAKAVKKGYKCILAFVIQMENIYEVRACEEIHPDFAKAMENAKEAGVEVLFLPCKVYEDEVFVDYEYLVIHNGKYL